MKVEKVYTKNSTFQKLIVLKTNRNKRYRYNEFLVEGVRNINEAIRNNWNIKSFIYAKGNLSDWAKNILNQVTTQINYCLSPELMKELSKKIDSSELMAIIEMSKDNLNNIPPFS